VARLAAVWVGVLPKECQRIDRSLLLASCPVCGQVVLRADGVSREGGARCGQVSGNRCQYRRLGGTAAALLPQPRRSCPLVGLPVDIDRSAGRAADSGCPTHTCRIAGRVSDTRAAHQPSAMAALGRTRVRRGVQQPGEWTGGRTHRRGWFQLGGVRAVGVRPPRPPRGWGRTAAEPAAVTSDRFRRCRPWLLPGFRTPRTARRIPPWPVSGWDRYRNRSPGRRPLVGWSQRW
jgi:hypothetical protein